MSDSPSEELLPSDQIPTPGDSDHQVPADVRRRNRDTALFILVLLILWILLGLRKVLFG
jgi:hypothetical protein